MNYSLNEEKMYADITEGSAIIINSETGIYYGINGFGTNVYENIVAGAAVEDIKEALVALPGAPATIADDLDAFVQLLVEKEILLPSETIAADVTIDVVAAEADEYVLSCMEFADAQELLLADPIHEVKEDEGWSPELGSLNPDADDVAAREAKMQ